MTNALLGALMALSTFVVVMLVSDNFLTKRSTNGAGRSNVGNSELQFRSMTRSNLSLLLIAALMSLAVASFGARLVAPGESPAATALAAVQSSAPGTTMAATYNKLRQFAGAGESSVTPLAMSLVPTASDGLPDVETMIRRLATRLQQNPNDAEGWRMLGWSYFNTNRYAEAATAYDKAIALDPGNAKLVAARDETKSMTGDQDEGPTAANVEAAAGLSDRDRARMVASMVDGLAQRLAKSPHDEAGWVKLMRSRMVLGEAEAARKDFLSAKQVFADEPEVVSRLTEAARAVGVPSG